MKIPKFYETYTNQAALAEAIVAAGLPGYDLWVEPHGGGLLICPVGDDSRTVAAPPFWEGALELPFQVTDDYGHISHTLAIYCLRWAGNIADDVVVWQTAVAPLLAAYLPVQVGV